jgi:hypothetical protein
MFMGWWSCSRNMACVSLSGMEGAYLSTSMAHALTATRTTHPIVDRDGRVIGLLAGRPQGAKDWDRLAKEMADAVEAARSRCEFTDKQLHHRRGVFPAVPAGIIHGNGTPVSCVKCTSIALPWPPSPPSPFMSVP